MLKEKKRKLTDTVEAESTRLEAKRGKWDAIVITKLEDAIQQKKESLESINFLLSVAPDDTKSKQELKQMQKRKAFKIFKERRIKRRAIAKQGRPTLLDSDDGDLLLRVSRIKQPTIAVGTIWSCILTEK